MALSLSSLTSSLSSLSFSSHVSSNKTPISLQLPKTSPKLRKSHSTPVVASASSAAVAAVAGGGIESATEIEGLSLEKFVKTRLPGGFAAQTLIGTGRRKCAIARVVIQEGSGKFIINYRDAKV